MEKKLSARFQRQPSLYLSHGGGPCFWIEFPPPLGAHAFDGLRDYLSSLIDKLPQRPSAILIVSAHWEEAVPTFGIAATPNMIFDYYGFPEHTYALNYPAPGAPGIAIRAQKLLENCGIVSAIDDKRGFDHGVFVPLLIINPDADIPIVTLSLQHNLDPQVHIAIGAALAPLRDENVLIIGSGNSYHNLQRFFDGDARDAKIFDDWLAQSVTNQDVDIRKAKLIRWKHAPCARVCHPREEHLLPLMVAAGAGMHDKGQRVFSDTIGGKAISCFSFG